MNLPCTTKTTWLVSLWWPHLGFDILNVLLQPLDQLVYFQDLVLAVAEVVTVIPGRQLKLIILQDREVRAWAPTLWSLSALIPTVPRLLSPDSLCWVLWILTLVMFPQPLSNSGFFLGCCLFPSHLPALDLQAY